MTTTPTIETAPTPAARRWVISLLEPHLSTERQTIEHLCEVLRRDDTEPLDLSDVADPEMRARITAEHDRRHAETLQALAAATERLAAVHDAIVALSARAAR
jgi:16S rRNA U1498 N3-methylase RsmE